MSEVTSEIGFDDVTRDPNFLAIVLGAAIWLVGPYIPLIGPFFVTGGFVITVFATASTAAIRPTKGAWQGLIVGALIYLVGVYISGIPIVAVFANFIIVPGAVLILFFAIPIALAYGNAPLMKTVQEEWDARQAKKPKPESKTDASTSNDV
ncbi:MAG: hypothetical protein ACFFD6_06800 [Candidatus Thorarchaeota archaeon]